MSKRRKYKYQYHPDRKYFVTAAVALSILAIVLIGVYCWPLLIALVPAVVATTLAGAFGVTAATAATVFMATTFAVLGAAVVAGLGFLTAKLSDWFYCKPTKLKYDYSDKTKAPKVNTTHAVVNTVINDAVKETTPLIVPSNDEETVSSSETKTDESLGVSTSSESSSEDYFVRGFNGMNTSAEDVADHERAEEERKLRKEEEKGKLRIGKKRH